MIGAPIAFSELAVIGDRQALADHLRDRVYALAKLAPRPKKDNPAERLLRPVKAALKQQRAA